MKNERWQEHPKNEACAPRADNHNSEHYNTKNLQSLAYTIDRSSSISMYSIGPQQKIQDHKSVNACFPYVYE